MIRLRWVARRADPPGGTDSVQVSPEAAKGWSDTFLHSMIAKSQSFPYGLSVLESELRVREAWRSPATWALAISVLSLCVAVAALIIGSR